MTVKKIIFILIITGMAGMAAAQTRYNREFRKAYTNPDELVSLSSSMSFSQALVLFNDLSKRFLNKPIIDPLETQTTIGVDINQMHWMDAFELILKKNNLWYEEYPDYIRIVANSENVQSVSEEVRKAKEAFETREVVFSAIFFETNNSKLREAGMSWDFFRDKDVNLGTRLSAADNKSSLYEIDVSPDLDFGSLLAIFKALESDQVGEVVASPQVTVKSGEKGRVQVGSDIAVTVRDFAGNSVTKFFSTGSIINVMPTVVRFDSIDFINMDLEIERSNSTTSDAGLEIKKSSAQTSVLLLDGEETIIGGLYVNEESNNRDGVPFLKDLPWWFFGLRYMFGYESKKVIKNDLLILIKAELLPTLSERFESKVKTMHLHENLREKKNEIHRRIEQYKKEWQD